MEALFKDMHSITVKLNNIRRTATTGDNIEENLNKLMEFFFSIKRINIMETCKRVKEVRVNKGDL